MYCVTLGGPISEPQTGQLQGASSQEWPSPFQEGATPQMADLRLARRERLECTMTALRRLPRAKAIACAPRLVPAHSGCSERVAKHDAVH